MFAAEPGSPAEPPAQAEPAPPPASEKPREETLAATDREFIQKAAEAGKKEIETAQLASSRSSNHDIRDFADFVAMDLTKANGELTTMANRKGVQLPETPEPAVADATATASAPTSQPPMDSAAAEPSSASSHAAQGRSSTAATPGARDQKLEDLRSKSGEDFDREYLNQVIANHEKSVAIYEFAARESEDPEVRVFAGKTLPRVQAHLRIAREMQVERGSVEQKTVSQS